MLTPENDPTAFAEKRDGLIYHLCDLPRHNHHVPFPFGDCYETLFSEVNTWELKYSRKY
jgi:hypothetical protein